MANDNGISALCAGAAAIWIGESNPTRRDALLAKHLGAFRASVAKRSTNTTIISKERRPAMASLDKPTTIMKAIAQGMAKSDVYSAMLARAEALRQPNESTAQSFAKCYSGLWPRVPGGPQLMAAFNAMPQGAAMTKTAPPSSNDGDADADDFANVVDGIVTMRKCSRSQAQDIALQTPGGRQAFQASLSRSRQANS